MIKRLSAEWFARPATTVARELLGTRIVHRRDGELVAGRIVETEAYLGIEDAASHAAMYKRGRSAMERPPGRVYMYRAYGIHAMFNIMVEGEGSHGAVLLRAIEPVEGLAGMIARRGVTAEHRLGQGPGNLCVAMGFTLGDDDRDLTDDPDLWIQPDAPMTDISVSTRVGITKNPDALLRFFDPSSRAVSGRRK